MNAIAIKHNDQIIDLQTAEELGFEGEQILLDNSADSLEVLRHSTAHLMAQAIKSLYPDAEFYVGPVVKEGFYYDFKVDKPISDKELKDIEKAMKKLLNKKYDIEKYSISKEEANYISEVYQKLADLTGKSLEVIDIYEEIFEREKDRLDNLDEFISKLKGLEEEGRNYLLTILEGVVKIDGNRAIFEKIKEELLKDR